MSARDVHFLRVFAESDGRGGNPVPIVLDADGMSDDDMRQFAAAAGYESGFVVPPDAASGADFRMRYFVPEHEMEMCGHATVGGLWALRQAGLWQTSRATIATKSGLVRGFLRSDDTIEITQPRARLRPITDDADVADILRVLGASREQLLSLPILNASTSRVKTLVPLRSVAILDGLSPDFRYMRALCEWLDSTGLYPFAIESAEQRIFHARQFPRSSGYPEDAATGIAAAALLYGLRAHQLVPGDRRVITILQGRAMGSPSRISVRFGAEGCLVGGRVIPDAGPATT